MSVESWLYLALICFLGASSPGPSLILILRHSFVDGRSAGIKASTGHGLGIFIYALVSASGLSFVLSLYPLIFGFIQFCGAIFLICIGGLTIKSVVNKQNNKVLNLQKNIHKKNSIISSHFRDGFAIAILNPKILVFFASLFSQFLENGQSFILHLQMAFLAGLIDLLIYVFIVIILTISYFKKMYELYNRVLVVCFGIVLIVLGLSIVVLQYLT